MKRTIFTFIFSLLAVVGYAQGAKKPTMMVIPSDKWCIDNGYFTESDNAGTIQKVPDYTKAYQSNFEVGLVTSQIGEMFSAEGFPLVDLQTTLKGIQTDMAMESVETSKDSGDMLAETQLERLSRVAKPDIVIQVDWSVNANGFAKSVNFNMQAIDSYTRKQVAGASGTGKPAMGVELPVMLRSELVNHIRTFTDQITNHFNEMATMGREITLVCRRWSGSEYDFESAVGDNDELGFMIEDWVAENTVGGRFSTAEASENRMYFTQVRIALATESGRAIDARYWARGLLKELGAMGIPAKLTIKGLGQAIITIGGK